MSTPPIAFSPEEWLAFCTKFSELKHTVNNALAVFMALAELAHRNPENYEKLGKSINTRTPDIVGLMQEFTRLLDEKQPISPEMEL